jgi:hypothetical protein
MALNHNYKDMDKWELIDSLSLITGEPTIQQRKIVSSMAKIFEELGNSNKTLANRVFYLNIVIALSAVAGVIVSIVNLT